ncbi:hypothetical protein QFC22_000482 [Naganishia vaughanmartiniae]|uniref:Uncharacterized protein n=1 Tax=Naganishia vaughanmartiniae TaxID=1424756 RepID=A0ACC2XQ77_9TREE|nr:hypothetical protein QFC22_000482 [Naganishia vaughanmartiniae]
MTLRDKALEYEEAGRNDVAFVLMARAATIIIQKLPTHPEYTKIYSQQDKARLSKTGDQYLKYLAALRDKVAEDIARWTAAAQVPPCTPPPAQVQRSEASRDRDRHRRQESGSSSLQAAMQQLRVEDTRMSASPRPLRTSESHIFEYPKMPDARDYTPKITYQPPSSNSSHRQTSHEPYGEYDSGTPLPPVPHRPTEYNRLQPRPSGVSTLAYPAPQQYQRSLSTTPSPVPSDQSAREHPTNNDTPSRTDPMTRRQTGRLLSMRVPSQLITKFLNIAQKNTSQRVETLGLLLGTEHMQYGSIPQLVVEVLLIPKQTGTSDTCAMLNEEDVLAVSLERGLDCLGWVSLGNLFASSRSWWLTLLE